MKNNSFLKPKSKICIRLKTTPFINQKRVYRREECCKHLQYSKQMSKMHFLQFKFNLILKIKKKFYVQSLKVYKTKINLQKMFSIVLFFVIIKITNKQTKKLQLLCSNRLLFDGWFSRFIVINWNEWIPFWYADSDPLLKVIVSGYKRRKFSTKKKANFFLPQLPTNHFDFKFHRINDEEVGVGKLDERVSQIDFYFLFCYYRTRLNFFFFRP